MQCCDVYSNNEVFSLLNLVLSFEKIEKLIIETLINYFPNPLNITDLTRLIGYSNKSKHISRSHILEKLQSDNIITIKSSKKSKFIFLNLENEHIRNLMKIFIKEENFKVGSEFQIEDFIDRPNDTEMIYESSFVLS